VTIRVIIDDDHPTFVRTLSTVLRSADVDVIATASDGNEAVRIALELQPDIALMDLHMPGIDGIDATARITDAAPFVAVVVLTMFDDDDSVFAAMQAGARGYLVKGAPKDEILRAVEAAGRGRPSSAPQWPGASDLLPATPTERKRCCLPVTYSAGTRSTR